MQRFQFGSCVALSCTHLVLYQTIQSLQPCPARLNGVSQMLNSNSIIGKALFDSGSIVEEAMPG